MRSNVSVWNGVHLKRPPLRIFYVSTALSVTALGDSLLYTILPSYYPHLGLTPFHVGVLLSVNRWIRLGTNHMAEHCYQRYPSPLWLILAFFVGSFVTAVYGIAQNFLIFLGARILWGVSFSFIRQAGIMTAVSSGPKVNIGERMGYYYGINGIWLTAGVLLGGLSHDIFGFSFTFVVLSILSLVGMPLGILSQKGLKWLENPPVKNVLQKGDVGIILCGFAVGIVGYGMIISTMGLILKEQLEESYIIAGHSIGVATLTGIMLGLHWFTEAIGSPIFGAIADRIGKEQSILFLFFIGTIAIITAGIYLDPILLFVIMPVIFICNTTLSTLLSSQAGLLGTRSVASFATTLDLGMSFGPLLGWSIVQLGFPTNYIFILSGTFYIIGAMIFFRKFRNLKIN